MKTIKTKLKSVIEKMTKEECLEFFDDNGWNEVDIEEDSADVVELREMVYDTIVDEIREDETFEDICEYFNLKGEKE